MLEIAVITIQFLTAIIVALIGFSFRQHEKQNELESIDRITAQKELSTELSKLKETVSVIKAERLGDEKFYSMYIRQTNTHTDNETKVLKLQMDNLVQTMNEGFKRVFDELEELKDHKKKQEALNKTLG